MREGFEHLSRRQRQVVDAVVSGKSNKIIAYDLGLSTRTVELHRANAMAKLGVANVAELVRLVDSLSAHEDILRASAESFPGMVAFWNRALVCTFANDAYLEWFGKPAHAVLGTGLQDLLGDALFEANKPHIVAALAGKQQRFRRELTKADGTRCCVWANYVPAFSGDGSVTGFFVFVTDITPISDVNAERPDGHAGEAAAFSNVPPPDAAGVVRSP